MTFVSYVSKNWQKQSKNIKKSSIYLKTVIENLRFLGLNKFLLIYVKSEKPFATFSAYILGDIPTRFLNTLEKWYTDEKQR